MVKDFAELAGKYKEGWQATGYGSVQSQTVRHSRAVREIDREFGNSDLRILDFGCGIGDFHTWFGRVGRYVGIDQSEPSLVRCRETFPDGEFIHGGLDEMRALLADKNNQFDAVVANGVFTENSTAGLLEVTRFMETGYALAADGGKVVFDLLSTNKDKVQDRELVFNLVDIYKLATELTYRVNIDHSYAPHCFTVILHKGKSEWEKSYQQTGSAESAK